MTITPTNNSNVFGAHIKKALYESSKSKTFEIVALFDAKRYSALCIDSVPMCSICLATCTEGNLSITLWWQTHTTYIHTHRRV